MCNYDYIKMCECVLVCVYCASRKQLDERRTPHPSNQAIVVLTENLLLLLVLFVVFVVSGIKSVLLCSVCIRAISTFYCRFV